MTGSDPRGTGYYQPVPKERIVCAAVSLRDNERQNTLAGLMEAVKYNCLGQIAQARHEVGGEHRRNM